MNNEETLQERAFRLAQENEKLREALTKIASWEFCDCCANEVLMQEFARAALSPGKDTP